MVKENFLSLGSTSSHEILALSENSENVLFCTLECVLLIKKTVYFSFPDSQRTEFNSQKKSSEKFTHRVRGRMYIM